jgi:DNA repair exonuclease SbcCD ATPase subunit
LKAIKAEAARNPIETLQNDYGKRQEGLRNFASRISDFATAVGSFEDKLGEFKRDHPEDAPKFDEQLRKMKLVLENRKAKFKEAQTELAAYDKEIKRANDIWQMGQAAAAMTSAAGMTEDDFLQKISTETALDSVQKSMNRAFADLEVSLLEEQKPPQQLPQGSPPQTTVEVEPPPVRSKRQT